MKILLNRLVSWCDAAPTNLWRGITAGAVLATAPLAHADTALTPTADSYVRNSATTTNYGADTSVVANNANGVRVFFLRFDLSGISGTITRLKLDLTPNAGNTGNSFNVYGLVSGESWAETGATGITWSNAPGVVHAYTTATGTLSQYLNTADLRSSGTPLASFLSASSGTVTAFDVTSGPVLDFVHADADKVVTFMIAEADPSDTPGDSFNSREAASGKPTLTVSTDAQVVPSIIQVVLQGGQSNSDGRAAGSGLPTNLQQPQPDILFYYYTNGGATNNDGTLGQLTTLRPGATEMPVGGFGPEVTLGHDLAPFVDEHPGNKLAILKYAKGGSNLHTQWKAGGDATTTGDGTYYVTWQTVMKNGLAKLAAAYPTSIIRIVGMIWVQGESDIDDAATFPISAYGSELTAFIADFRLTFGSNLPFFLSRISANQTIYSNPSGSNYSNYLTLRAQQASVAANVANAYMIDTDGSSFTVNSDNLHFSTGGQQALGSAFATKINQVLGAQSHETESLTVANYLSAAGGTAYVLPTDSNLSNSDGTALQSNNTGDYVTYVLPNVAAGTYDVRVGMKKNTSRGQFQLQIGRADNFSGTASNVGPVVDQYASSTIYTEVDLGLWSPSTTNDKWFRFNVVGKNSASSGTSYNYSLAFDYITLTPR